MSKNYRSNFLVPIFGEYLVNNILELDSYKIKDNLNELIKIYKHSNDRSKRCTICRYLREDFECRKMDFPSWIGTLDFSRNYVREIMVIGESITSSRDANDINITWGLARKIKSFTNLEFDNNFVGTEKLFWKRMKILFKSYEKYMFENLYLTDVAHCNTKLMYINNDTFQKRKRSEITSNCAKMYLLDEICYIKPKILISHGSTLVERLKEWKKEKIVEFKKDAFPNIPYQNPVGNYENFYPLLVKIKNLDREIPLIIIPHLTGRSQYKGKKGDLFLEILSEVIEYLFNML